MPLPPIAAVSSKAVSERLNCKAALLVIAPVPSEPVLPPAPTATVPALMVVVPV